MVIFGIGFVGCAAWYFWPTTTSISQGQEHEAIATSLGTAPPILRISYPRIDNPIKWQISSIFPETHESKSPFNFAINNVGGSKAIDIEILFRISIGFDNVRQDIERSGVFHEIEISNNEFRIPLEFVLGRATKTTFVGVSGDNIRRINSIDAGAGSANVDYPLPIQNLLSIMILSRSFIASKKYTDLNRAVNAEQLSKLFAEKNRGQLIELHKKSDEVLTVECPDVFIEIRFSGIDGKRYSYTDTIRSIIKNVSPTWVWEDVRAEKLFFEGGSGIFSFEDKQNPDDGFYNRARKQGLLHNNGG